MGTIQHAIQVTKTLLPSGLSLPFPLQTHGAPLHSPLLMIFVTRPGCPQSARPQPASSLSNPMQPHIHTHPPLMMIQSAQSKRPAQALPECHFCNDHCVFDFDGIQVRPLERERKDVWAWITRDVLEAKYEQALAIRHQCKPDQLLPISLHIHAARLQRVWGEDSFGKHISEIGV